jgi:MFS transporter, Spinster family, sphingosine-1-phosphate transporter
MNLDSAAAPAGARDEYILGRSAAWFAFAMTMGLMLFDYIDRQVIVSLFPYLKAEWALSDKQLGLLVSVVSVTVALGGLPVALLADRYSRVKSIAAMAGAWSLATISCMFTRSYAPLFAARAVVGLGEAGYGSVGGALIASVFPSRLRAAVLSAFMAAASVGSVLGVLLGGVIAAHWGWKAAFGVVGIPGLLLSLLYLFVRDYRTVDLTPELTRATHTPGNALKHIIGVLARTRTLLWVCAGSAVQLIVVSAVWAWLPSYLSRVHGMAPEQASIKAAVVVLCGAAGTVVWGAVADRCGAVRGRLKLHAIAVLCVATTLVLLPTFGAHAAGIALAPQLQFALIALGGFLMTCSVGTAAAVVIDVAHPGVRATGAAVLSLFQNLFGLAIGPFLAGALSDAFGLEAALTAISTLGVLAALLFARATRSYESDMQRFGAVRVHAETSEARWAAGAAVEEVR